MKWLVVIPVVLAMVAVKLLARERGRFRVTTLGWVAIWFLALYVVLEWGFVVPVPDSVVKLYFGIALLGFLVYTTSDRERLEQVRGPIVRFMTEPRYTKYLAAVVLLVPALLAVNLWIEAVAEPQPPAFGRSVHPAPPDQIVVQEETFDLTTLSNPYRHLEEDDPEEFARRVEAGRVVYYENCFYCHGDLMRGDGQYAHGFVPIPTNFQDAGTIAMLQESFLFWRIAKGGPGLPAEGGPWDSAMPAWEDFLTEEQMWDVILFLYDFTGQRPRARHEIHVE